MQFNSIPSTLRVPLVSIEVDSSNANSGPIALAYRVLIMGQKHGAGAAAANSFHRVTSADQVATLAGRGSMLHRQALAYFSINKSTETWIGVLADNAAGVIAEGSVTLAGTATAAGSISLYLGGELVQVAVAVGDSAATIAAALASAIGKHATGTVTFVAPGAADTVTIGGILDGVAVSTAFVGTVGAVVPGAATYSVDTDATAAAASFAAQVAAHATASRLVRPTAAVGVVTLRAVQPGTAANAITLVTTDAVNAAVSGATLAGGVAGTNPDLAVHASVSGAVVSLRANNAGAVGNEFDVRVNYRPDSEATPAGLTVALVQPTGGASNPSLTALIAAAGDVRYHIVTHPYTDATSLTALENEFTSRAGPLRMVEGYAITAKAAAYATVSALGDSRNNQYSVIEFTDSSPTPPTEYASHVAAVVAYHGQIDPARPMHTLALPWIKAPAELDRTSLANRNLIVGDGISTTRVGPGDVVQIESLVTTYQLNAAGSPDLSLRQLSVGLILMYAINDFKSRMSTKYPRHKLGDDSTAYPPGEAIMTPSLGKAEAVSWFKDMSESSPVVFDPAAKAQFIRDLVVERNASDPDRLDFLLPPDLINKLVAVAAQIRFRT